MSGQEGVRTCASVCLPIFRPQDTKLPDLRFPPVVPQCCCCSCPIAAGPSPGWPNSPVTKTDRSCKIGQSEIQIPCVRSCLVEFRPRPPEPSKAARNGGPVEVTYRLLTSPSVSATIGIARNARWRHRHWISPARFVRYRWLPILTGRALPTPMIGSFGR